MSEVEIDEREALAADRYANQAEKTLRVGSGAARVMAAEAFMAARRALTLREVAIVDMAVVKGRSLAQISSLTGSAAPDLALLLKEACTKLADHYDAEVAARVSEAT